MKIYTNISCYSVQPSDGSDENSIDIQLHELILMNSSAFDICVYYKNTKIEREKNTSNVLGNFYAMKLRTLEFHLTSLFSCHRTNFSEKFTSQQVSYYQRTK